LKKKITRKRISLANLRIDSRNGEKRNGNEEGATNVSGSYN